MRDLIQAAQTYFSKNYAAGALKLLIVLWALFVVGVALLVDNAWVLAGILAYEVLP